MSTVYRIKVLEYGKKIFTIRNTCIKPYYKCKDNDNFRLIKLHHMLWKHRMLINKCSFFACDIVVWVVTSHVTFFCSLIYDY